MAYTDKVGDVFKVTTAVMCPNSQVQEASVTMIINSPGGGDSRSALAAWMDSLMDAHYKAILTANTQLFGTRVANLNLVVKPTPAVTHSGTAGTGTLIAVPTQCRPLTKWLTSFAGRQYRGRTYWPSPDTSCQDTNGHPNAKLQGIINAIAEQIRVGTTVGGTQWGPVIWHRPKPPAPDLSPTPIIGQAFSFQWGTQHRSGDYGRPNLAPW